MEELVIDPKVKKVNGIAPNPEGNVTIPNMKGATSSAAGTAGLVPAPAAGSQATKYLRADGSWQVPDERLILQRNTTYAVGDIAYHKDLPSWARLECVRAGTTGDTISFMTIQAGQIITIGTAKFIVDDIRDGTPVGMVRASLYLPDGYIKANGANVLRADYPRLVNLADKHNLWTEDTANYPGLFGVGDGLTTFTVPNWIDRMAQFGTGIGNAISAGLPNIEGVFDRILNTSDEYATSWANAVTGAFANSTRYGRASVDVVSGDTKDTIGNLKLDASAANAIYGASATVQPPAIGVLPILKY